MPDSRPWRDLLWDGAFAVRVALFASGAFWAGQLWHPAESLAGNPSYRWMYEVGRAAGVGSRPGHFWACVFTAEAAVCAAALVWRNTAARLASVLAVGVVRGAVAYGVFVSNPADPEWGMYAIFAGLAYWLAAHNARAWRPRT